MSNYPAQIDNNTSLPIAVDTQTPVQASIFNPLRNAVLAIESTLGVQPNGAYGSVASRLTTLEGTVGNLQIISLAGDLGHTLAVPLVIGIQGRPVSNAAPTLGQTFMWNGIAWVPASVGGDVTGPFNNQTVIKIQGNPFTAGAPTKGQFVVGIGSSTWGPTSITGDINSSAVTAGLLTVTGIQGNTFTAGSPVKGQFVMATTTSNYGPVTISGDVSESGVTPGLLTVIQLQGKALPIPSGTSTVLEWSGSALSWATTASIFTPGGDLSGTATSQTVVGIRGNTITAGALTTGQFLVATSTSNWAPTTLSGDILESGATAGLLTVTGLQGNPVPAPTEIYTLLTWNGTAFDWSLPVNTVGPQSTFQHAYGQFFNLSNQPQISVPGSIPVVSNDAGASYLYATPDPTRTSFFGTSAWFVGLNNLTRIDEFNNNISQIPLDDLPGFASFASVPNIIAMAVGPQPGVPNYTKLYAFDANMGLFRFNILQGSFGVEANLPLSVFGGTAPTSIHFDSFALIGNFALTHGLNTVTAGNSQTGIVAAGSKITFGTQGAVYTVLSIDVTGMNIVLTTNYTGPTTIATPGAINNNQIIAWSPSVGGGTLYFISPDFSSVVPVVVDVSGITGGLNAWETLNPATYTRISNGTVATATIFMQALGLDGKIWAVGVNTITHASTHFIMSTATSVVGSVPMGFSYVNHNLYLSDGATIYTLDVSSNTQTHTSPSGTTGIIGLAVNDGTTVTHNDELAIITATTIHLYHNLGGTLVQNTPFLTLTNAAASDAPFFSLYKHFAPPNLSTLVLDPSGWEGDAGYWVTDFSNNVIYNLTATQSGSGPTVPGFNFLYQPGAQVSWQPGPFTPVSIASADSPYITTGFDHYVIVDTSGSDVDVHLSTGATGLTVVVMDGTGGGALINVTSPGFNINGSASPVVLSTSWQVKTFVFNGNTWNAY